MLERFSGEQRRGVLVNAIREQKLVGGNAQLAERIANIAQLKELPPGTVLIQQNAYDNDVYLLLAGTLEIIVNGRKIGARTANDHVGEMSAIQPSQPRSATVIAAETSVVCKLTEPQLSEVAREYSDIWRLLARELARRLDQRNALVTNAHQKIRVFIVSSAEALPIARAVQNAFDHDPFKVVVWTDNVFLVSWYPVESLEQQLDQSDFAIALVTPDDLVLSRDMVKSSPRDNVVFELGLFIGRIGRKRSFLLEPRGEELKLPSDLTGITTVTYKYDGTDLAASVAPACNRMREIINDLGPNN